MKSKNLKIILIILLLIVVLSSAYILYNYLTNDPVFEVSEVGTNEYGTVYRIVTGNNNSDESIGIILGIHSRESNIHKAINSTFYKICLENQSHHFSKKYIIYYVILNDEISGREDTRDAGESLGEQYIVPNIVKENVSLIIDVHMINPRYEYSNFVFSVDNSSDIGNKYADKIADDLDIKNFEFDEGSSPSRITIPISESGIPTLLIEFDINSKNVEEIALNFLNSLDNL